MCICTFSIIEKLPNPKWQTLPIQHLGYILLAFLLLDLIDSIDKHELTGQNLSRVFNSTCAWGPKNARLLKYQAAMFQFRDKEV
jgi:hypothetical protein